MIKLKHLFLLAIITFLSFGAEAQTSKPNKNIPAAEYYEGGQDSLYAFINRNIKYPIMAKRNRIQGECVVKFVIDADGQAKEYSLVKNIGAGCGEEAFRVAKLLKFKSPGFRIQTSIPIIFKL
jgi:protein TonB